MPELPEVETIRRGLAGWILNKKVVRVEVLCQKSFVGNADRVINSTIIDVDRKGKALIIRLDRELNIMVHLRMTGQLICVNGEDRFAGGHPNDNFLDKLPNKQTRVIFYLDDGMKLFFNDQRKFGFCKVLDNEELARDEFLQKLGKEPWETNGSELFEVLSRKSVCIKAALLDQSVIAGLGNIYVDETLFASELHPETKCRDIGREKCEEIVNNARKVMEKSLESGGSTIRNYVKADGTKGNYLDLFAKVYGREGKECAKCGGKINKMRVAGRGTYYCPHCQKKENSCD